MNLHERLRARLAGKVAVIGMGNSLRGDDAAGCRVAQRLQPAARARVFVAEDVPENVLFQVAAAHPDTVVFIDAVDLGAEPGDVALLERGDLAGYTPTTHRVPLRVLIEVLRRETRADVFVLGIQPGRVGFGSPISSRVEAAVGLLAAALDEALLATPPTPSTGRAEPAREIGP